MVLGNSEFDVEYCFKMLFFFVFFFLRDVSEVEAEQKVLDEVCYSKFCNLMDIILVFFLFFLFFDILSLWICWIHFQAIKNARERERRTLLRAVSFCFSFESEVFLYCLLCCFFLFLSHFTKEKRDILLIRNGCLTANLLV